MSCYNCKTPGLCCSFSIKESNIMWVLPNYHCKFLGKDKKCTIYDSRYQINPECGSMKVMESYGGMPPKCNYHATMTFKHECRVASPKNERRLWKKIQKLWGQIGEPFSYDKELSHDL